MAWTLGGVTIHVDDQGDRESVASLYALQQVLDATEETISYYGAQSDRRELDFVLDENLNANTGKSTLKTAARANSNCALVSDQGAEGNYRILEIDFVRLQALNKTNPVYRCTASLVKV